MVEFSPGTQVVMKGGFGRIGHNQDWRHWTPDIYGAGYTIELVRYEPPRHNCPKCGRSDKAGEWVARILNRTDLDNTELRLTTTKMRRLMKELVVVVHDDPKMMEKSS
jgi:hypothetical protein